MPGVEQKSVPGETRDLRCAGDEGRAMGDSARAYWNSGASVAWISRTMASVVGQSMQPSVMLTP